MYVFGGRDNVQEQLNDLWVFNLESLQWTEIRPRSELPLGRIGHSCDIIGQYMIIFGGFYRIANELNDLHVFDFEECKWMSLYEQPLCPSLLAAQDFNS